MKTAAGPLWVVSNLRPASTTNTLTRVYVRQIECLMRLATRSLQTPIAEERPDVETELPRPLSQTIKEAPSGAVGYPSCFWLSPNRDVSSVSRRPECPQQRNPRGYPSQLRHWLQ